MPFNTILRQMRENSGKGPKQEILITDSEWVDDFYTVIILSMTEIFADELGSAGRAGGGKNYSIPERSFPTSLFLQGGEKEFDIVVYDRPGGQVAHNPGRIGLRHTALAEVDVHFLKNLNTDCCIAKRCPSLLDKLKGHRPFGRCVQVIAIKQYVCIEEPSGVHELHGGSVVYL